MANNDTVTDSMYTDSMYYVYLLYYARLIQNKKQEIDEFYKIAPGNTEGIEGKNKLYTELRDYIKTFKEWLNAFLVYSGFKIDINEEFNRFQNLLNDLRVTVTDDALRESNIAEALTIWKEGHPGISHQSQAEWEAKLLSINTKFDEILKDKINSFMSQHQKILNMYNKLSENFNLFQLETEISAHIEKIKTEKKQIETEIIKTEKKQIGTENDILLQTTNETKHDDKLKGLYYNLEEIAFKLIALTELKALTDYQQAQAEAQNVLDNAASTDEQRLEAETLIAKIEKRAEIAEALRAEIAGKKTNMNLINIILSLENITEFVLYNFFKNIKHLQNDYFSELIEIISELRGKPEPDSSFLSWLPFPATEKPLSFYQAKLKTLLSTLPSTYKETPEGIKLLNNIKTELRRRAFAVEHYFELNIIDAKRTKLDELEEYYDKIKKQIDGKIQSFGTKKGKFFTQREQEELAILLELLKNYNLNKYIWWLLLKSIDPSNEVPEPIQEVFEPMIESKSLFSSSKTKTPMFNDFFQKKLQRFFKTRKASAKKDFEKLERDIKKNLRELIRNNDITEIRIGIRSIDFIQSEHFVLSYEDLEEMEKSVYKEVYTEVYPEVQEGLTVPEGGSRKKSRNTKNKRQINRKSRNTKNKRQMNRKSNKAQKKSKKRRN